MEPLFRPEAVEHRNQRLLGEILLATPASARIALFLLGFATLILVIALFAVRFDERQTVRGWLEPIDGIIRFKATGQSTVEALYRREGDRVLKGDPILTVSLLGTSAADDSNARLLALTEGQRQEAESRLADLTELASLDARTTRDRIVRLRAKLGEGENDIALQKQQNRVFRSSYEEAQGLKANGFVSSQDLERRQEKLLGGNLALGELLRRRLSDLDALRMTQDHLDTAVADRRSAASTLNERIIELTKSQIGEGPRRITIRAAADGTIAALPVKRGDIVAAGAPLFSAYSQSSPLRAELFVPPAAAGRLRPGMPVLLQYDAYPYPRFAKRQATIVSISGDLTEASALPFALPTRDPVYRVVAAPTPASGPNSLEFAVRPSMTLTADIIVQRRSLWTILTRPLRSIVGD